MQNPALYGEAAEMYRAALKAGRRFAAEQNGAKHSGLLPVLEPLLGEACGEVPLGLYEIPLKKIRGTYAAGRSHALAGNFMPLLDAQSEFASKWRALCASALEKGIVEPVRVYEYLGYYYVLEGHKRASVASVLLNYSLLAEVTRLTPPAGDGTPEYAVFTEMLGGDRKKIIRHMWFSAAGRVTGLRGLAGGDEELLESAFTAFRAAYHKQGFDQALPGITTGDAFWQYAKIYGLPDGTDGLKLQKDLSRCRPQWELLSSSEPAVTVSGPAATGSKPIFFLPRAPSVTFAYRGPPGLPAEAHEAGRFALKRAFPGLAVSAVEGLPAGTEGDVIFVTDPALSDAALRVALERKNALVLLCHDEPVGVTGTYYAKTEEAAFLMGALAGCLSQSGGIGYYDPGGRGPDRRAFGQGASASRPAARVYTADGEPPLKSWAGQGVDVVLLPRSDFGPRPAVKSFPGVYAHLCALSREGTVTKTLAAAAWHWDAFYVRFVRGLIEGGAAEQLHYRMGLGSGVLDVHLTAAASGAKDCLSVFRHALVSGLLNV